MEQGVIEQKAIVASLEEEYINFLNEFGDSDSRSLEEAQYLLELQQDRDRAV